MSYYVEEEAEPKPQETLLAKERREDREIQESGVSSQTHARGQSAPHGAEIWCDSVGAAAVGQDEASFGSARRSQLEVESLLDLAN